MYMNDIPQSFPFSGLSGRSFLIRIYFSNNNLLWYCYWLLLFYWREKFCRPRKSIEREKKRLSNNEAVQNVRAGVLRVYRMVGGSGPIPPLPNWIKPISRNNVQSPVCNLFITQIIKRSIPYSLLTL
jgi:hypothetical protein